MKLNTQRRYQWPPLLSALQFFLAALGKYFTAGVFLLVFFFLGDFLLVRLPTLRRNSYLRLLHPVCTMGGDLSRASNHKITSHEPRDVTLTTDGPKSKFKLTPENGGNHFIIKFQISRILNFKIIVPISHYHVTDFKKNISNFKMTFVSNSSQLLLRAFASPSSTHSFLRLFLRLPIVVSRPQALVSE